MSDSVIKRTDPVLPNLGFAANNRKKRKTDAVKKNGREKKSGKHDSSEIGNESPVNTRVRHDEGTAEREGSSDT